MCIPHFPSFFSNTIIYRDPKLILDDQGRIIAILLGTPEDPEWPEVIKDAVKDLARARRQARRYGSWNPGSAFHRRGWYLPLTCGVSFGGGQIVSSAPESTHSILTSTCSGQGISSTAAFYVASSSSFYAARPYAVSPAFNLVRRPLRLLHWL